MQLGLLDQKVSVGGQLVGAAEQSSDAMHKLGHQAGVCVVSLAIMVGHDLWRSRDTGVTPPSPQRLAGTPTRTQL